MSSASSGSGAIAIGSAATGPLTARGPGLLPIVSRTRILSRSERAAAVVRSLSGDFRLKVQSLGAAGKLGAGDAAQLDDAAASAVGCIESIGT